MNYTERHAAIVTYMHAKIVEKDWHGVSDAANDLREIEAEERVRRAVGPWKSVQDRIECGLANRYG